MYILLNSARVWHDDCFVITFVCWQVSVHEYTHIGRVTEFRFCTKVGNAASALWEIPGIYDPGHCRDVQTLACFVYMYFKISEL